MRSENIFEKIERNIINEIKAGNFQSKQRDNEIKKEVNENCKLIIQLTAQNDIIIKLIYFILGVLGSMFVGLIALVIKEFFVK